MQANRIYSVVVDAVHADLSRFLIQSTPTIAAAAAEALHSQRIASLHYSTSGTDYLSRPDAYNAEAAVNARTLESFLATNYHPSRRIFFQIGRTRAASGVQVMDVSRCK